MGPRPYSERSSLPNDTNTTDNISADLVPPQLLAESPSPPTLSAASTPSPISQDIIPVEYAADYITVQEEGTGIDTSAIPCYPAPGDTMPYDHALPDFIRQITNQPNLQNLHSLSLRVISRMISLQRMSMYTPNLRELDLEGSMLSSLRDIGCNLKYLQVLKVGRCQLDSLDGTFGLTSLRELYAQKNLINDVSPCSNLPHIRHIDISYNRIRNISYAGFLSMCSKLRSIIFTGNPATEVPGYRDHVRRILPQIECLDDVPFLNEENCDDNRDFELIENCARSDSSLVDVADYISLSPSDSMNNLFEPQEDGFAEKSSKHARNVANQEQFEATDYEVQELFAEKIHKYDLENDFDQLYLTKKGDKNRLLEQAKMIENKNTNLKQKCTSIQKLDKDIENRSKKSNLSLKADFDEDLISLPQLKITDEKFKRRSSFQKQDLCLPLSLPSCSEEKSRQDKSDSDDDDSDDTQNLIMSSSPSSSRADESQSISPQSVMRLFDGEKRPSTAIGAHARSEQFEVPQNSSNSGAIKKRPSTAAPVLEVSQAEEDDEKSVISSGASKLTSGMPVCGNLTAALRNRKKHQTAWEDKDISKARRAEPLILIPKHENSVKVDVDASGDGSDVRSCMKSDDDLVEEDVLASSKKWREAFRRFRSNNRARWEEEDKMDYSSLLGDTTEENSASSFDTDIQE